MGRVVQLRAVPERTGFPLLDEILEKWEERGVISHEQAMMISARAQKDAFHLAVRWDEETVRAIKDLITRVLNNGGLSPDGIGDGLSESDFAELARGVCDRFDSGWYADLVYRNNVHSAQMEGRRQEMFSPEWAQAAPYWQFVAIHDSRNDDEEKCPDMICRKLDGAVFRKSDTMAMKFWPALHHACRCSVLEIGESRLKRKGLSVRTAAEFAALEPQDGFGYGG